MYEQYENLNELENIMTDANEFIVERIKKLNKLSELGINPYPYNYDFNKKLIQKRYVIILILLMKVKCFL